MSCNSKVVQQGQTFDWSLLLRDCVIASHESVMELRLEAKRRPVSSVYGNLKWKFEVRSANE